MSTCQKYFSSLFFLRCSSLIPLLKDRSLGSVELRVSDLAKESSDTRYPFESTGPKVAVEPIQLDKGSFKGELHYTATFVPALALKGVKFDAAESRGRAVDKEERNGGESSSIRSRDGSPLETTIKRRNGSSTSLPLKDEAEPDGRRTPIQEGPTHNTPNGTPKAAKEAVHEGVEMSTEEILSQGKFTRIFS